VKLVKGINPALKVAGVKSFAYEELVEATGRFSEENRIGQGGYGTVYKGKLQDGKEVAIKRSKPGSGQGAKEFYNEIQLLSRVHHKNLVMLEGYCDEENHQVSNLP
jgi:serine/threonine protein kinase